MTGDHDTIDVKIPPSGCPLCTTCPTDDRGFEIDNDDPNPNARRFAFGCRCCGLMGPRAIDADKAVEMWNFVATAVRLQRRRADLSSACNGVRDRMVGLREAQDLHGKIIHDGKFLVGHDRALDRVTLAMSETMPSVAIDPLTAVTLAMGLLEVAAIVDPKSTDHFAKLVSKGGA